MGTIANFEDYIRPARINDADSGLAYELDFSRESVRFAESRGFRTSDLSDFPTTKIPEFFYYAFRKNHKNIPRATTDKLLDAMGGMPSALLERLSQLYNQAGLLHLLSTDEDAGKNGTVTVEL